MGLKRVDVIEGEPKSGGLISALVKLVRPRQWTKNLLVFAGALFAGKVTQLSAMSLVGGAFVAMCLASSATYIFNDILDRDKDRQHPKKRLRPIASGAVPLPMAQVLGAVLLVASLGVAFWVGNWVLYLVLIYLGLQVAYNIWLKHWAVADVFVIASGFILRASLGAEAIHVAVSGWLLFCTAALSLMLGFAKRREEFLSMGEDRGLTRQSLHGYNRVSLDILVAVFAGVAIMSYCIYSLDSITARHYPALLVTSPFVVYGVSRYLLLVFAENEGGEPADILLKDKHIIASVLGFLIAALVALSTPAIPIIER